MKKETRQLILLVILIAVGGFYAYYTYLFTPEWEKIQSLEGILQERQERHELLLSYVGKNSELDAQIRELDGVREELQAQIPQEIDKPNLVTDLYTVAKINQVQPRSVTFASSEKRDNYIVQSLTFSCLGPQESIIKMIDDLQMDEEQRFTLENMRFSNDQGILQGELQLKAYATSDGD